MAGSLYERLGILHAGVASTQDPKYTVVPQRERVEARAARHREAEATVAPRRAAAAEGDQPTTG